MARRVLSKKGKTLLIISIIVGVLVIGGSGYLLWRINQEEKLSSEDAEAKPYIESDTDQYKSEDDPRGEDQQGGDEEGKQFDSWIKELLNLEKEAEEEATPRGGECIQGSDCPACEWPGVGYCGCSAHEDQPADTTPPPGICGCRNPNNFTCGLACGSITKCSPPACPDGWESCGVSGDSGISGEGCVAKTSCDTACTNCKNKSVVKRYCKEIPEEQNTCDGGGWTKQIPSKVQKGQSIEIAGYGEDSDGIDPTSVSISVDGESVDDANAKVDSTDTTKTNWDYTLTGLEEGDHTVTISWKDNEGLGGSDCTLTATFSVEAIETNPDWNISKVGTPVCVEGEEDALDTVEVAYVITIKNTGDGEGTIEDIVDSLDSKVEESFVSEDSITQEGTYASGEITWDPSGEDATFDAGESKTYAYEIVIPRDSFGTYENIVIATPTEGDSFSATAEIGADCTTTEEEEEEEVPDTGIFDEAGKKIAIGFAFLTVGMLYMKFDFVKLAWQGVEGSKKRIEKGIKRSKKRKISNLRDRFERKIFKK
jgi:hypothetical protein